MIAEQEVRKQLPAVIATGGSFLITTISPMRLCGISLSLEKVEENIVKELEI